MVILVAADEGSQFGSMPPEGATKTGCLQIKRTRIA